MTKAKTKVCTKCGKRKNFSDFSKDKNMRNGIGSWCKECTNKKNREYRKTNLKKVKESVRQSRLKFPDTMRAFRIKRTYGVTLEEYDNYYANILKRQNGCCAKCGIHCSEKKLVLDHDHNKFGVEAFRGLLCSKCNKGLGLLGDNLGGLLEAINYLERFEELPTT